MSDDTDRQNKDLNTDMLRNLHIMQPVSVPAHCGNRALLTVLGIGSASQTVSGPAHCDTKDLLTVVELILPLSQALLTVLEIGSASQISVSFPAHCDTRALLTVLEIGSASQITQHEAEHKQGSQSLP
ncbi:hypothetical protein MPER_06711 [Moniliophthora perniciosa FA553]|nr:hypothetical protein MPER_06711 [Moniliophthora perniciosa FA553]